MNNIIIKTYPAPPINLKEVLRYAGAIKNQNTQKILYECIKETTNILTFNVCYCELPITINNDVCDFDAFKITSQNLASNLKNCKRVIVMGATVGIGLDRLIVKYSHISPTKALLLQAFGTERIETLCNTFTDDIKNTLNSSLKARFSPGYGDLSIDTQKIIFAQLNPQKHIGLTLNDSMLMTPSKSVTAFIGIEEA